MSWLTAGIDSAANAFHYANTKFRTRRRTPPYIDAEVPYNAGRFPFGETGDGITLATQRRAITTSWIYTNIDRIGKEVSSANFSVFKRGTNQKDINHPLEQVLQNPNSTLSVTDKWKNIYKYKK